MEIFTAPTIGPTLFGAILSAAKSPVLIERPAGDYYSLIAAYGIDPAFALAVFRQESTYGTNPKAVVCRYQTFNWANCRSRRKPGLGGKIVATDRGNFWAYRSWYDGLDDLCYRLADPTYAYAGKRTVEEIVPIMAPPGDMDNDPTAYVRGVVAQMTAWQQQDKERAKGDTVAPKIAIASGHHNNDGGNTFEIEQTGELAEAVARHCARLGMEVRVMQPDGPDADSERGDGMFPGGIWDVARAVVALKQQGWVPDIFIECHTEGGGTTGVFAIYPDWDGDVDGDVRDKLGPLVAQKVAAATGLGLRRAGKDGIRGVCSEQETGVGLSGYRLGIFNLSAPLAATTTRLIVEYGAHDKEPDLTIVKRPGFYDAAGKATAEAFAEFMGVRVASEATQKEPITRDVPPGYLRMGQPDVFDWQGEGVITYRKSRWYNPTEGKWYERSWDHESGFSPWTQVA